jgi:hypothetical protein
MSSDGVTTVPFGGGSVVVVVEVVVEVGGTVVVVVEVVVVAGGAVVVVVEVVVVVLDVDVVDDVALTSAPAQTLPEPYSTGAADVGAATMTAPLIREIE